MTRQVRAGKNEVRCKKHKKERKKELKRKVEAAESEGVTPLLVPGD